MGDDPSLMEPYRLADRLGCSIADVRAMPLEDANSWVAYFISTGDKEWRSGVAKQKYA